MKYLPNQLPKYVRLSRAEIERVSKALMNHATRQSHPNPPQARLARAIRKRLPQTLPYDLSCLPHEWELLSQALRPEGSTPTKGTEAARLYALYTKLRPHMRFTTAGLEKEYQQAVKRRQLGK